MASSVSLLSVPTELAEDVVDALQGAAGVLQRDDGVVEGRRLFLAGDRGDLGLVLGKGALVGRHKCSGLMRENGGAPNGVFQVSKKGFSVAVIPKHLHGHSGRAKASAENPYSAVLRQ